MKIYSDKLGKLGFSEKITKLTENHAQSKIYLIFRNLECFDKLSESSCQTLVYQDGPMSESEAVEFEMDLLFKALLKPEICIRKSTAVSNRFKISRYASLFSRKLSGSP